MVCVLVLVAWHPITDFSIAIYRTIINPCKMEMMLEKEDAGEIRIDFWYFVENCFCSQLYWFVMAIQTP
jgi:hypothetical protein